LIVEYKTILYGELTTLSLYRPNNIYNIEIVNIDYCCPEMESAFDEGFIGFGDYEGLNRDCNVNLYKDSYGYDNLTIKFCPFCKKPIITKEVKRVKLKKKEKTIRKKVTDYEEVSI